MQLSFGSRLDAQAKVALEHRPKTPDAAKKAAGASGLGCFGGPADGIGDGGTAIRNSTDGDDRETLLPPGLVGLRNIGGLTAAPSILNASGQPAPHTDCLIVCSFCHVVAFPQHNWQTAIGAASAAEQQATEITFGVACWDAGNTCFVNAAMQCLRHTPGLPLALLPDLLTATALEASAPTTPRSQAGSTISRHASQQDMRCGHIA